MKELKDTDIKLTDLEDDVLNIIRDDCFYRESLANLRDYPSSSTEEDDSLFAGYDICSDCNNPKKARGAVSSLVKKGILEVVMDDVNGDPIEAYYTHYIL